MSANNANMVFYNSKLLRVFCVFRGHISVSNNRARGVSYGLNEFLQVTL